MYNITDFSGDILAVLRFGCFYRGSCCRSLMFCSLKFKLKY